MFPMVPRLPVRGFGAIIGHLCESEALKSVELGELIAIDGTKLSYRIWKPTLGDSSANVALLHGLGIHGGRYAHLAARLLDQGQTVYALDLRGHGLSGGPRGQLGDERTLLSDIDAFLRVIEPDEKASRLCLLGESMGGLLALATTARNRNLVKKLVLLAPALRPHRRQVLSREALSDLFLTSLRNRTISFSLTGWRLESTARLPSHIEETRRDPLTLRSIDWRYACTLAKIGWNWSRYPEAIACPALILMGTNDLVVDSGSVVSLYRKLKSNSRKLEFLDGAYHALLWDTHVEQVLSSVSAWLGSVGPSHRSDT
jgi:acylglycerol lipase